jgi:hypothetical protein
MTGDAQYPGLDHFGRAFIQLCDYRIAALAALVLTLIGVGIHYKRTGLMPSMPAMMNACVGFLSIFGGLAIGVTLLFTSPPAFELLSHESLGLIGVVTLLSTLYLGVTQIRANLLPPIPPPRQPVPAPPQESATVPLPARDEPNS